MARKTTGKKPATNPDTAAADSTDAGKTTPNTGSDAQNGPESPVAPPPQTDAPDTQSAESGVSDADQAPVTKTGIEEPASPEPLTASDTERGEKDPAPEPQAPQEATTPAPAASLSDPGPFSNLSAEAPAPDTKDADTTDTGTTDTDTQSDALLPDPGAPKSPDTEMSKRVDADTPIVAAPPPPAAAPAKSGFLPLLLGGLVAGGIGYGAHFYLSQQGAVESIDPAALTALQSELDSLRADLDARPASPEVTEPDLSAIEAELAELRASVQPQPDISDADVAALVDAQIAALRDELADAGDSVDLVPLLGQIDTLSATVAELQAQMADLRDLAEIRVAEAEAAVDTALARSGVQMMRSALELGAPYPEALALMRDANVSVPDVLSTSAQSGVPTIETLQERYPAAARAALREALQDAPADSTTERLGNFLRAQVGARSTAPREGDDPDAVLSRAGAAVEAGDLDAALTELGMLPEAAQAEMSDWRSDAQARRDVEAVLPEFVATYLNEQGSL